jgi:hypothetical protein
LDRAVLDIRRDLPGQDSPVAEIGRDLRGLAVVTSEGLACPLSPRWGDAAARREVDREA